MRSIACGHYLRIRPRPGPRILGIGAIHRAFGL